MITLRRILFLISFLALVNCGKDAEKATIVSEEDTEKQTLKISAKRIEEFRYNDYILSNPAEKAVSNWINFTELSQQIGYLKSADFTFFKDEIETLRVFIKDLNANIPSILNTNPIKARIKVVETKLFQLNNDLTLDNISKEDQLSSIKALLIAASNLNFVINKALEFEAYEDLKSEE